MQPSRALARALEPVAGQVYFAPECHRAYEELGFGPSPRSMGEVALPDGSAYFCSRASVMGDVPGEVVAATFGVFNPEVVVPAVAYGWSLTDAASLERARTEGATGQLRRILGDDPPGLTRATELLARASEGLRVEGRALFAGLVSRGLPDDPLAAMWRLADRLREYRGDVHLATWSTAGFDAVEIGLLTELYWGLPMGSYIRSRAWRQEQLDAAQQRLADRGLVADGAFTDAGRTARAQVEKDTDLGCQPIVDNLGDDLDELVALLGGWAEQIQAAGGYPPQGPHDLARQPSRGSS